MPGDFSFKPVEKDFNFKEVVVKLGAPLRRILAEVLKIPDFYFSEVLHPLELRANDIPESYQKRDLIDLGSASGTRYSEIRRLFNPNSYLGIDKQRDQIVIGKLKLLNMQQMDFIADEVIGDLGVAFGTHVSPEIADKLKDGFKNLIIGDYSSTQEEATQLVESYTEKLGELFEKTVVRKRRSISLSMGAGFDVYIFVKSSLSDQTTDSNP